MADTDNNTEAKAQAEAKAPKDRKPRESTATVDVNGVNVIIPRNIGEQDQVLNMIAELAATNITLPDNHPSALKAQAILIFRKGDVHAKASISDRFRDGYMAEVTLDHSLKAWITMETLKLERAFSDPAGVTAEDGTVTPVDPAVIRAMRQELAQVMIRHAASAMCELQTLPEGSTFKIAGVYTHGTVKLVRELKAPKGSKASKDPKAPSSDAGSATPNNPNVTPDAALAPGNVNGNGSHAASDAATIPATESPARQDRQDSHNPRERKHAGVK